MKVSIPNENPAEVDSIAQLQAQLAAAQAAQKPQPVAPVVETPAIQIDLPVAQTIAPAPVAAAPAPALNLSAQMEKVQQMAGGGADILAGIDVSKVETTNFRLLPAEVPCYEATITKAELGKSSKGDPQIKLTLKTTYPSIHAGVTLMDFVTITEKTMWKYKGLLEATGLLSPDGARFGGNSVRDFVGCTVQFSIKHEEWDGSPRNKINGSYSAGTFSSLPSKSAPQVAWATPAGV